MKSYAKHVFICSLGDDCIEKGSADHYDLLKKSLRDKGGESASRSVKITRTQCIGACGFGPNIAIYPEGVWYYGVQAKDIDEIVDQHLLQGRVVSRLLFHKYGETLPDEVVRDLVCGMVFRVSEAEAKYHHQGETYYFCGQGCLEAFRKKPAEFLQASHHGHGDHGRHA